MTDTAPVSDVQAQLDELRAQLEDLANTFDAAAVGQEGAEGHEGQEGQEGKEGEAGVEVNNEGDVTNINTYEVNENGETTPPPSEAALEKKGGITKKNLKAEAEKEGFKPGGGEGGLKPGEYEPGPECQASQFGAVGEKNEEKVIDATKDVIACIEVEMNCPAEKANASCQAFVYSNEAPFAEKKVVDEAFGTVTAVSSNTKRTVHVFIPKGKILRVKAKVETGKCNAHIQVGEIITLD